MSGHTQLHKAGRRTRRDKTMKQKLAVVAEFIRNGAPSAARMFGIDRPHVYKIRKQVNQIQQAIDADPNTSDRMRLTKSVLLSDNLRSETSDTTSVNMDAAHQPRGNNSTEDGDANSVDDADRMTSSHQEDNAEPVDTREGNSKTKGCERGEENSEHSTLSASGEKDEMTESIPSNSDYVQSSLSLDPSDIDVQLAAEDNLNDGPHLAGHLSAQIPEDSHPSLDNHLQLQDTANNLDVSRMDVFPINTARLTEPAKDIQCHTADESILSEQEPTMSKGQFLLHTDSLQPRRLLSVPADSDASTSNATKSATTSSGKCRNQSGHNMGYISEMDVGSSSAEDAANYLMSLSLSEGSASTDTERNLPYSKLACKNTQSKKSSLQPRRLLSVPADSDASTSNATKSATTSSGKCRNQSGHNIGYISEMDVGSSSAEDAANYLMSLSLSEGSASTDTERNLPYSKLACKNTQSKESSRLPIIPTTVKEMFDSDSESDGDTMQPPRAHTKVKSDKPRQPPSLSTSHQKITLPLSESSIVKICSYKGDIYVAYRNQICSYKGDIYVAYREHISRVTSDGEISRLFEYKYALGVAVSNDRVFVLRSYDDITVYSLSGQFITKWTPSLCFDSITTAGEHLVLGGPGYLSIYTETGQLVKSIKIWSLYCHSSLCQVDNTSVIVKGVTVTLGTKYLLRINIRTGNVMWARDVINPRSAVSDGRGYLYVRDDDGRIHILDVDSGLTLDTIEMISIRFSPASNGSMTINDEGELVVLTTDRNAKEGTLHYMKVEYPALRD